jgi:Protein of unknown function (DUF3574)
MRTAALVAWVGAMACSRVSGADQVLHPLACAANDQAMIRDVLYFGRNKPAGGEVTDAEWDGFLNQFVTPRFPNGLTVVHATGQWRGASGQVERERAAIVTLLHATDSTSSAAVGEVAGEYKQRFGQEAVLRERDQVCASF